MWSFGNAMHVDKLYTFYPVCEAYHYCLCRKMHPQVKIFSAYFIPIFLKYSWFYGWFFSSYGPSCCSSVTAWMLKTCLFHSQDCEGKKGKKCKSLWLFWDIPYRKTFTCCMKRYLRWRDKYWFYYTGLEI